MTSIEFEVKIASYHEKLNNWRSSVKNYYDLGMKNITFCNRGIVEAQIDLFEYKHKEFKFLIPGGRFGFNHLRCVNEKFAINKYLRSLEKLCDLHDISGICLATSWCENDYAPFDEDLYANWRKQKRYYQIVHVDETVREGGLSFSKALRKGGFRYSLRKSRNQPVTLNWCENDDDFDQWYFKCYAPRMTALRAKLWSYELIKDMYDKGFGKLLVTKSIMGEVIFGIFCLEEASEIIVFALAASAEYHSSGVNLVTIEKLYIYAYQQEFQTINWQGSGSNKGVFDFKESWNAKRFDFQTIGYTKISNDILNDSSFQCNDLYILPLMKETL